MVEESHLIHITLVKQLDSTIIKKIVRELKDQLAPAEVA